MDAFLVAQQKPFSKNVQAQIILYSWYTIPEILKEFLSYPLSPLYPTQVNKMQRTSAAAAAVQEMSFATQTPQTVVWIICSP